MVQQAYNLRHSLTLEAMLGGWLDPKDLADFAERIGDLERRDGYRAFPILFKWLDRYNRRIIRNPPLRKVWLAQLHCSSGFFCTGDQECPKVRTHSIKEWSLDLIPKHPAFGPKTNRLMSAWRRSVAAKKAWRQRRAA